MIFEILFRVRANEARCEGDGARQSTHHHLDVALATTSVSDSQLSAPRARSSKRTEVHF
jgi:hypothetical protein